MQLLLKNLSVKYHVKFKFQVITLLGFFLLLIILNDILMLLKNLNRVFQKKIIKLF